MAKFRLNLIPAFAIALVSVGTAFAGPDDATWDPPARYSAPFKGKLIERPLPIAKIKSACRSLYARHNFPQSNLPENPIGCAIKVGRTCTVIFINRPDGLTKPSDVRRHEVGHCVGWPANHPQ